MIELIAYVGLFVLSICLLFMGDDRNSNSNDQQDDVIDITIEKHDGLIFVYNRISSEYMANGKSLFEVNQRLQERYPNKKFRSFMTENEFNKL